MRNKKIFYNFILMIFVMAMLSGSDRVQAEVQTVNGSEDQTEDQTEDQEGEQEFSFEAGTIHYCESEENNSFATADDGYYAFDLMGLSGNLSNEEDKDYYKLTLTEAMMVQFDLANEFGPYNDEHWNFTLFRQDEEGNYISYINTQFGDYAGYYLNPLRLPAGTYYFLLDYQKETCIYTDADYLLRFFMFSQLVGQDKYEQESNDTCITALPIKLGNEYAGNFNTVDDVDYYTFSLSKKTNMIISSANAEKNDGSFKISLLSGEGDNLKEVSSFLAEMNEEKSLSMELEAGTYYLKLEQNSKELIYPDYRIKVSENKPATPTGLVLRDEDYEGVGLSWEKADGAMAYYIYRSAKKNSGFQKIGITTESAFLDQYYTPGKTYYYKVKAINRDLYESSFGKVVMVKTEKQSYPDYSKSKSIAEVQKENGIFEILLRDPEVDKKNFDVNSDNMFYYTEVPSYDLVLTFHLYDAANKEYRYHVLNIDVKNENTLYMAKKILQFYYPTGYKTVLKHFMQWYNKGTVYTGTFDSRQIKCTKTECYISALDD